MLFNSLLIQIKIKKSSSLYAYIAYHCIFVYIFEKANSYMQKYLNTNCVLPFPEGGGGYNSKSIGLRLVKFVNFSNLHMPLSKSEGRPSAGISMLDNIYDVYFWFFPKKISNTISIY